MIAVMRAVQMTAAQQRAQDASVRNLERVMREAEANTTPYIEELPNLCGDNSEDAYILPWNNTVTPWVSTLGAAVLTSIGVTNPSVDVSIANTGDFTSIDEYLSGSASGVATFSGTGAVTAFTIPHGLEIAPKTILWNAKSADAKGDAYVSVDATNITLTYAVAPASGTGNVVVSWRAET